MEALGILLALTIPLGLVAGWVLGIAGWRQARRAREEIAALREALRTAGIAVPEAPAAAPGPIPWARPSTTPAAGALSPDAPPKPATTVAAAAGPPGTAQAPPAPATAPEPPARSARPAPAGPGLEEALTLRWGVWLGAAALLLAGVFLLRTAVEEGWLGPAARCALAGLLGLVLILAAEWLRRHPLPERQGVALAIPWPDQAPAALAAGGVAVLFGAAYATAVMYALVPPLMGFALLALAALAGIALALVLGPVVAAIGIAGAYVTPALIETQNPSLPGLFAYLLAVTAAALAVLRQVGAAWLGWAAVIAAALWALAGAAMGRAPEDLWPPALFLPATAALHLALLPRAALDDALGRRLAWVPFAVLAATALLLVPGTTSLAPAVGVLLLSPVALAKGIAEPQLDRLPWLAALAGLLMLLVWSVPHWQAAGEPVTVAGVVQGILPAAPWPPEALHPFLGATLLLALLHAAAGLWQERRAPHPLRWAALPAAVPVLALLVAYARVRGFALDAGWALVAAALAAGLVAATAAARQAGALQRAGTHAAGAMAALALGTAMVLTEHWLTLAVALFLPSLAWVEARADLAALRRIALAVAAVVLTRLVLNWYVLGYDFGRMPVLNGLLLAYGVPAACFALAAFLFRRRGEDATVAVLEAGALAFLTALVLMEIRHAMAGGDLMAGQEPPFREAALHLLALSLLATGLRLLNRRLGDRPVLRWGWRLQQGAALILGLVLVAANPAFDIDVTLFRAPVLNELLLAYALPAALAAIAAGAPESAWPPGFRPALLGYAFLAAFAWITLEVRHEFHPVEMSLDLAPSEPAELYAYSGAWLGFGAFLLALGIRQGAPALRRAALAVMALTVAKVFLVDMAELVGLLRVLSFLGLGLALIALGWVYRRFVVSGATAPPAPAPPG